MTSIAFQKTDDELDACVVRAGITADREFEYGEEVIRDPLTETVCGVFWVWVSDDECGISANDSNYHDVREVTYAQRALSQGAPYGSVEGTVSLGDDAGSYVKVLMDMDLIVEISEYDEVE